MRIGWRSRAPVFVHVDPRSPAGHQTRPLLMFCETFAARGRAHARAGRGCERTAKEKRGLVEGKREDVMVFKNTGHLVR